MALFYKSVIFKQDILWKYTKIPRSILEGNKQIWLIDWLILPTY